MSEKKYSGSVFELGQHTLADLQCLLKNNSLTQPEKDLLTALFDLCPLDEKGYTDSATLCDHLGIKYHAIRKRLQPLIKHGFFTLSTFKSQGKRAQNLHTLVVLSHREIQREQGSKQLPLITEKIEQRLEELMSIRFKIDDFFCGFLFPVLRYKNNKTSYSSQVVSFSGNKFTVTASAREGYSIATVNDLKYAITLLTLVDTIIRERKEEGQPIQNKFAVDLKQILLLLGLKNEGGNRRTAIAAISRWNATGFKIEGVPDFVKKRYGDDLYAFQYHQIITDLSGFGHVKEGQKIPSCIVFSLSEFLFSRINEEGLHTLFAVSPKILKENQEIAIAFHMWCRRTIGHSRRPAYRKIRTLWRELAPGLKLSVFRKFITGMIEKNLTQQQTSPSTEEVNTTFQHQAIIHGYIITLMGQTITIRVDLEDPFMGDQSAHHFLKNKKKLHFIPKKKVI